MTTKRTIIVEETAPWGQKYTRRVEVEGEPTRGEQPAPPPKQLPAADPSTDPDLAPRPPVNVAAPKPSKASR